MRYQENHDSSVAEMPIHYAVLPQLILINTSHNHFIFHRY